MPKYRRIPGDPIEAVQWTPREIGTSHPGVFFESPLGFHVITIHGQKTIINSGDWILPEPDGIHYYPCKPDVFAKTYELAEPPGLQKAIMDTRGLRDDDPIGTLAGDEQVRFVGVDHASGPDKCVRVKGERLSDGGLRIESIEEIERAVDTTDITEGALEPIAHGPTADQIFDCENNVEPARTIAERIASNYQIAGEWRDRLIDNISHAIEDAMTAGEGRATARCQARIVELEAQLQAEGEHTAAANANIDRLNTEIERVTRRQQGPLMGKD